MKHVKIFLAGLLTGCSIFAVLGGIIYALSFASEDIKMIAAGIIIIPPLLLGFGSATYELGTLWFKGK